MVSHLDDTFHQIGLVILQLTIRLILHHVHEGIDILEAHGSEILEEACRHLLDDVAPVAGLRRHGPLSGVDDLGVLFEHGGNSMFARAMVSRGRANVSIVMFMLLGLEGLGHAK